MAGIVQTCNIIRSQWSGLVTTGCGCKESIDVRDRRDAAAWKILSRNLALHHHRLDQELDGCLSAYHFFQFQEVRVQEAGGADVPVCSV